MPPVTQPRPGVGEAIGRERPPADSGGRVNPAAAPGVAHAPLVELLRRDAPLVRQRRPRRCRAAGTGARLANDAHARRNPCRPAAIMPSIIELCSAPCKEGLTGVTLAPRLEVSSRCRPAPPPPSDHPPRSHASSAAPGPRSKQPLTSILVLAAASRSAPRRMQNMAVTRRLRPRARLPQPRLMP